MSNSQLNIFNDTKRNQINVAICGPVSAGKSTLLNSLFVASYSDMRIKRTTMTPQVYYETEKKNKKHAKTIKEQNKELNKRLDKKKANELTLEDISETHYMVPKVKDLVTLEEEVYLTVYDLPGLNDSQTKKVYFEYMDNNFYKFDVILFVVDINSALNTSDEIEILEKILKNSKENFMKFGIQNKLVVIANKCDDLRFDDEKKRYEIQDEELAEMFEQVQTIVGERVESIFPEMGYQIVPLSSEDSYIYRMYDENSSYELDMKHLNKFGCNEYGNRRWNRLDEPKKKEMIKKLMSKMDLEDTLKHTGFMGFRNTLQYYLDYKNQYTYLMNHIVYGLKGIKNFNQLDINEDVQVFYQYFHRVKEINVVFERHIGKEVCSLKTFHQHLDKYIDQYLNSIVQQYITVDSETIKSEGYIPQVEQIKKQFDEYSAKFNKSSTKVEFIKDLVTNSINNFYVDNIKSKQKGVEILKNFALKLVKNAYKVTKDLILNIFTNNDMKNKTAEEVLKYLETFEENDIVSLTEKKEILCDFIKTIYTCVGSGQEVKAIPNNMWACHFYHSDLFWTRLMLNSPKVKKDYLELSFLAKKNMCMYISSSGQEFNDNPTDVLKLEYYLNKLTVDSYTTTQRTVASYATKTKGKGKMRKSTKSSQTTDSDSGNLSEELDMELGLASV